VLALTVSLVPWPGTPARAGDPREEFRKGTVIVTPQVGGGAANNLEEHRTTPDVTFVNFTTRLSVIPLDPLAEGFWRGALEGGLEPWVQVYLTPSAVAEGLKGVARYHFLSASPIFPYVEISAGAVLTSLNIREIRSNFSFVMEGGAGLSYFVGEGVALTAGYRFQHVSNGGIERPNRGFNSDTGVVGVSFLFH
jgi:opacity protein-like surface antigen